MKRETPPYTPCKRKAKGKETRPGCFARVSKTARARAGACTYTEAGLAADEIIGACFPEQMPFRRYLAGRCRVHGCYRIVEKAYECVSRERQGEIKNGLAAFLAWIKNLDKEAK